MDGKKCHYLVWVPSESGPLVVDYGDFKNQNNSIPFDYLINKVKGYDGKPRISLSLDNQYVKYDFFKSYNNPNIDVWNGNSAQSPFLLLLSDHLPDQSSLLHLAHTSIEGTGRSRP